MAKTNPSLVKLTPASPSERNFVDLHKVKDVSAKMVDLKNGINNAQDKVKTFNRKENHFGNDETQSISQFDPLASQVKAENVIAMMQKVLKRVNHKNNKKVKLGKGLEIKEGEEVIRKGDLVHIGLRIKGGAGFRGTVHNIDEHGMAKVKLHSELYKDHPRYVQGHVSRCTKEEIDPATVVIDAGLKSFSDVVKELSIDTLDDYQKKATHSAHKLDATGNVKKADKRHHSINTALDKIFDKESVTKNAVKAQ